MLKRDEVPKCYLQPGDMVEDYFVCDLSATVSSCCYVGDVCLDNHMCRDGSNILYRGGCTDSTWKSSDCPQFCQDSVYPFIISCQNATNSSLDFCCENIASNSPDCCQTKERIFQVLSDGRLFTNIDPSASTATRHISQSSIVSSGVLLTSSFISFSFSSTDPSQFDTRLETDTSQTTSLSFPSSLSQPSFTSPSQPSFTSSFSQPSFTSSPSQLSSSTSAFTLSIGAKVGISVGGFIVVIFMILPSILLWRSRRSKRKNQISKKKASEDQFAKPELDANESQRPDNRMRELPGDMAHELRGEMNENEVWELPGDMIHELEVIRHGNGVEELPGDMEHELRGVRHINGVEELTGDMAHELGGVRHENRVEELPGDMAHELRLLGMEMGLQSCQ